jgi:hypothetical protein
LGLVPAASAVPDHEESIYVWRATPTSGVAGTECRIMSPELNTNNTPCRVVSYEMGNTDTHMFFRWTLATLEFSEISAPLGGAVQLQQTFRGSAEDNDRFAIDLRLGPGPELSINNAGRVAEQWHDAGEILIDLDEERNMAVMAIPLELIATTLKDGLVVGEEFGISSSGYPRVQASLNPLADSWTTAHQFPSGLANYTLHWYGDFVPAMTSVSGEIANNTLDLRFDNHTWESHAYTWTSNMSSLNSEYALEIEDGTFTVKITDPAGNVHVDLGTTDPIGTVQDTLEDLPAGDWTIELTFERFVGSFSLQLDPFETEVENGGGAGNETADVTNGTTDGDLEDTPAPGAVVLAVLLLAFTALMRRQRK